jgi:hypothetical protein
MYIRCVAITMVAKHHDEKSSTYLHFFAQQFFYLCRPPWAPSARIHGQVLGCIFLHSNFFICVDPLGHQIPYRFLRLTQSRSFVAHGPSTLPVSAFRTVSSMATSTYCFLPSLSPERFWVFAAPLRGLRYPLHTTGSIYHYTLINTFLGQEPFCAYSRTSI